MKDTFSYPLCSSFLPPESGDLIQEALASGAVGPYGPAVEAFRQSLVELHEGTPVVLASSGTAALHLGLAAMGIGAGDVVICPSFTFAATINAVKYCGAEPVFVDCRPSDWGMSMDLLEEAVRKERKVGRNIRGILIVHAYGIPMELSELAEFCRNEQIPLMEDTAGSLGSRTSTNRPVGLEGLWSAGSFNANKMVTTGAGGMLVSADSQLLVRAELLANQGKADALHYEHIEVGMNYRMSNLNAALGLSQMPLLPERLRIKREQALVYRELLEDSGVDFMPEGAGIGNHWMHAVLLPDHLAAVPVIEELRKEGIEAAPLWKPMHLQPAYAGARSYLSGAAESLFHRGVVLPSSLDLTVEDLKKIASVFQSALWASAECS